MTASPNVRSSDRSSKAKESTIRDASISGIAVRVPEVEPLVADLRQQYDPTALLGVPAHITLLIPFMSIDRIDADVQARLARVIARTAPFAFTLDRVGRWPEVVFLHPAPAEPFIRLTESLTTEFPGFKPYDGQFDSIVPHLTVAFGPDADADKAERELRDRLAAHGPVLACCNRVELLENSLGHWRLAHVFALAGTGA